MTTLLHFNIPASGHMNPVLAVIPELVARGARVVCCNTEAYREKIERAGAEFIPYPALPEIEALLAHQHEANLALNVIGLLDIGRKLLPMVRQTIQQVRPDAVLYDSLTGWGRWGAELEGVRGAGIITTFVIDTGTIPPLSPRELLKTMRQFAGQLPNYLRLRHTLTKMGVKNPPYLQTLMHTSPTCNIVFTSRALQPGGEKLGERFTFVGVSLGTRADVLDVTIEGTRPLVYISLGTINNRDIGFYKTCFAALGGLDVQVVMSVGRETDIHELGTPPDNFTVRPFVAQLEVLKHAEIFVTHGGMNSVHEGLVFGVPMVVIPQQSEQAIVARHIEAKGAGVLLNPKQVDADTLRAAVTHTLNNRASLHKTAMALGQTLLEAGGAIQAAERLLAWAQPSNESISGKSG